MQQRGVKGELLIFVGVVLLIMFRIILIGVCNTYVHYAYD